MAVTDALTTDELVKKLQLLPHPEGGFFKETFRDDSVQLTKDQLPDGCESPSCILMVSFQVCQSSLA
jgi:predicted cupin superfamily sugar epimerase